MKTIQSFNIEIENVEKIDKLGINKSEFVNGLIEDYFKKHDIDYMNEEELKKYIATEQLKEEYKKRLEEIESGNY